MMRFLWGGSEDVRKIAWVSWDHCCKPKSEGGLGVKDLESFNLALLGKWRWRLLHEKGSLWCKVLMAKYGDGLSRHYSVWWKDLLMSCVGPESGLWFENGLCWRIGDGGDTWFWDDNWHGKGNFKDSLPGLYEISEQKHNRISEMGKWSEGRWEWDLKWSRCVEGENILKLGVLAQIISSYSLVSGSRDKWVWTKDGSGSYSVSSAYETIFQFEIAESGPVFQWLWKVWAPSNARALGWRVLLDRVQTRVNLVRRNIPIQNSSCPWCEAADEATIHLFFHCNFAWQVWSLILNWLGILFVVPGDQMDHFALFSGCWSSSRRHGLSTIWLAVVWQLWISRNAAVFRDEPADSMKIFEAARTRAWVWMRARNRGFIHSVAEWLNQPLECLADI